MNKKVEAIKLKLQRSVMAMNDADLLMQNQSFNSVVNRLYYGCYYATRALLLTQDISPKTHKGVITMLNENFVQKALFEKKKSSFFSSLMEQRHESDYDDEIITNEAEIEELVTKAKEYITYVTKQVEDYLTQQQ